MKIVLFVNSAKTFFWHRRSLADLLIKQGHEVIILCTRDGQVQKFEELGYSVKLIDMSRKGRNVFKELLLILKLVRVFKELKPDLCHNFTIKCVVYGSLAQRVAGVSRIINTVTGLGIVFVNGGLFQRLVEILYRVSFAWSDSDVIFQNPDDRNLFLSKNLVKSSKTHLVLGSGVDIEKFKPSEKSFETIKIVFASRLLKSKGILDLLEASLALNNRGIGHELHIAGEVDSMSPDSITVDDIKRYSGISHIHWLGNVENVQDLLSSSHVACFPSYYREGVPKFLIESAASGLAIITTNAPGCREVVNQNGILVKPRDSGELEEALEALILNHELIKNFSARSRELAVSKFSEFQTLKEITAVY